MAQRRPADALTHWTKAAAPADAGFWNLRLLAFLQSFYPDREAVRLTSQRALTAAQEVLAHEPENGLAMGTVAEALVHLGERERVREIVRFGMLLDPDNTLMVLCFVRALALVPDFDAALDILEHVAKTMPQQLLALFSVDPAIAALREQPRYKAFVAAAQARFAAERAGT